MPIRYVPCVFLVALLLCGGCDRVHRSTSAQGPVEPPVRSASLVEASLPERHDISAYLEETGHITAENQVEVLAKGTGHCLSVKVEEGDTVRDNQVLAELDKAEMEAQVRQTQVSVAQQKIAYERAEQGVADGIVAPVERDNAKFSYEQSKAALDAQMVQLGFLTIRAPISGVITKRQIQEGMLVSSGMPVFDIVDPKSFILPIAVAERNLPRLHVGQEAVVTIDSTGDREFHARVRRINPGVDPQTGSVKVVLDFDPADYPYLRESAFARYRLVMETHENALVVPKDAVIEENAQHYVMVVRESTADDEAVETNVEHTGWVAARVPVETGLEDSNYTEILSGVDEDTRVITLGQQTVRDGEPVTVGDLEATLQARGALSTDQLLEKARQDRAAEDGGAKAPAQ